MQSLCIILRLNSEKEEIVAALKRIKNENVFFNLRKSDQLSNRPEGTADDDDDDEAQPHPHRKPVDKFFRILEKTLPLHVF